MSIIAQGIEKAFPGFIQQADGTPYKRPDWTWDDRTFTSGWYWENLDGDRFYFETLESAAEDFAFDIGFDEAEAKEVLAGKPPKVAA